MSCSFLEASLAPCPPPPFQLLFKLLMLLLPLLLIRFYGCQACHIHLIAHHLPHLPLCVCVCVCVGSWKSHLDLNCIAHLTVISFPTVATCVLHWNSNNVYIELLMNKMYANQSVLQLTIMFIDFQLVFILIDKTYSYLVFVYFSFSALTNCSSFVCLLFLLLEIKV